MLAGDPDRRTLDVSDPAQDGIRYTCLGGDVTETHGTPVSIEAGLTYQSSLSRTAQRVYELRPFSHIAGTNTPPCFTQVDQSGMVFTLGLKDPSTLPMVKADMMVGVNALQLIPSELWVSFMSLSLK